MGDIITTGGIGFAGQYSVVQEGSPMRAYYGYNVLGMFQEGDDIAGSGTPLASPGDVRVIDQDGNGQIDDRDNVFTETDPDWYGSINTTLNYKGFELFADVYFVEGATKLNTVLADGELWKGAINGIRTKYYTPEFPSPSKQKMYDRRFSL